MTLLLQPAFGGAFAKQVSGHAHVHVAHRQEGGDVECGLIVLLLSLIPTGDLGQPCPGVF